MVTDLVVKNNAGVIEGNFEDVKKSIAESLATYKTIAITEENKKDTKGWIADLRKQQKEFADNWKEFCKEYKKPLDEAEIKVKEILDLFNEPIAYGNEALEEFEMKRIEEKQVLINDIYNEFIGEFAEDFPLEKIFNPKWNNATYKDKQIKEDVLTIAVNARVAKESIFNTKSDIAEKAWNCYKMSLNLADVLQMINQYEEQKREVLAKEQEKIRAEEIARIEKEAREKLLAEQEHERQLAEVSEQAKAEVIDAITPDDTDEDVMTYTYNIRLTESGKKKFEMYMDSVGIEYQSMINW